MKKNRMMRVASALLIAVLLTTCTISGTFAKYTTSDTAQDTARVAKWGVNVMASGSLFGENYYPNATTATADRISAEAKQSVDTSGEISKISNIVAPGTQSDVGLTFSVSGTPEVANVISVSSDALVEEEIWLEAGTYGIMVVASGVTADNVENYYELSNDSYVKATTYSDSADKEYYELHDVVTVSATETNGTKYYPIVWTIANTVNNGSVTNDQSVACEEYQLTDVVTLIQTAFNTHETRQNNPNMAIDESVTLTWAWAFEGQQNGADTILGNLMANTENTTENNNYIVVSLTGDASSGYTGKKISTSSYNLEINFDIKIDVTQVD